jgi:hypothetical protein
MKPDTGRTASLDAVTGDLVKVIRRHDPEWTDANQADPGVMLLEVQAWIAEQLYYKKANSGRTDPYRNFSSG